MATFKEIQHFVKKEFGYMPKTCWIAHAKELSGLPVKRAWNREGELRIVPCPPEKVANIQEAFRNFGMI